MIRRTFRILRGVGPQRERRIWGAGIANWDAFIAAGGVRFAPAVRNRIWCSELCKWREAVNRLDERFFAGALAPAEHWRLFELFGDGAACLDIETTGVAPPDDEVTVVGVFRPHRGLTQLVSGINLSGDAIDAAFEGAKLIISFAGAAFDVPYLQKEFSYLRFDVPHYDLSYAARRLNLQGGLKKVERMFGLERAPGVAGLDGFDAVKLWRAHCRGKNGALELLLRYNAADTVNLWTLAAPFYEKMVNKELGRDGSGAAALPGGHL